MKKLWRILQPDLKAVENITRDLKCTPILGAILVNRKMDSVKQARAFLHPSLTHMRPPFSIKDMDVAVKRIGKAIEKGENILIFGDYDVDGITSAAVIYEFLDSIGAHISLYIPHRLKEGYGLQQKQIIDYAIPNRIDLIITTDCGSSSHEAIQEAQNAGLDVVVTDHHRVSADPPQAVALINPNRPGCRAGFEHLAGVGVAFMVVVALRKYLRDTHFWQNRTEPNLLRLCDLVCLGTLADAVPLVDENRILTQAGLNLIKTGNTRPGLKTLLDVCGINKTVVTCEDIAFQIVPRLNAAGRMEHARVAMDLLMAQNRSSAASMARSLDILNRTRKESETEILTDIRGFLSKNLQESKKSAIVLANHRWHEGVLGIVASRLVDEYHRPVILISTRDGLGKGSGRSIPGFDLYRGLSKCTRFLEAFGGHSMAAGLKIKSQNIGDFREFFEASVKDTVHTGDGIPELLLDCEIEFSDISDQLLDEIDMLRPFGESNPNPVFMARNISVKSSRTVGRNHRRMVLNQPSSGTQTSFGAIHFNSVTDAALPDAYNRIAFRLNWNHWKGDKTPQLVIVDTDCPLD
jgi:single-stranded-DNA-specific exonuclease